MLNHILETAAEIPGALFYVLVVGIGLFSWVFIWTREKKINLRDSEPRNKSPESGTPRNP